MFKNTMQGLCYALLFAWIVLLITTNNYILSTMSLLSIVSVIMTVVCSIKINGWSLGIPESVGIIIFVGFSVDYIVHMCHQYNESVNDLRKKKTDTAFFNIGSTIIMGAITSFLSGFFLMQCEFSYMYKFGVMMCVTIVSAMLVALVFFPAQTYLLGPQKTQGNIYHTIIVPLSRKLDKVTNKIPCCKKAKKGAVMAYKKAEESIKSSRSARNSR